MKKAIKAVRDGTMGYLKASVEFNVPKTTLKRRVKSRNILATESIKVNKSFKVAFVSTCTLY